jgi:hypothetical protein
MADLMRVLQVEGRTRIVILFYKYVFPCQFVYCKEPDNLNPRLRLIRDWMGKIPPEPHVLSLAYFDGLSSGSTHQIIEVLLATLGEDKVDTVLSILNPGVEVFGDLTLHAGSAAHLRSLGHLLRLRAVIRTLVGRARRRDAIISFLGCLLLTQGRELSFFVLSFYFTILFDCRECLPAMTHGFTQNITRLAVAFDESLGPPLRELFGLLALHAATALAPALLALSPKENPDLFENPVKFAATSLGYGAPPFRADVPYLFFSRAADGWSRADASRFLVALVESVVGRAVTIGVADCLLKICRWSRVSDPGFLFATVLPLTLAAAATDADALC